jgi:hypothetical protein
MEFRICQGEIQKFGKNFEVPVNILGGNVHLEYILLGEI